MHEIELKTIFKNKSFQLYQTNAKPVQYFKNLHHINDIIILPPPGCCPLSLQSPASRAWGHQTIMDFLPVKCSTLHSDVMRQNAVISSLKRGLFGCFEVSSKSRPYSPCLPLLIIRPWIMRTDPH